MTIKVTTESGSVYEFIQDNDQTLFYQGIWISGKVDEVNNGAICIGKPIDMNFYRYDMYNKFQKKVSRIMTRPVKDIQLII